MVISQLETITKVRLYSIEEKQLITELDSPAIGSECVVAERTSLFRFYSSLDYASQKIVELQREYKERNKTLKTRNDRNDKVNRVYQLVGRVDHDYSHEYVISHIVACNELEPEYITQRMKSLLENPKRSTIATSVRYHQDLPWLDKKITDEIRSSLRKSLL